MTDQRQLPKRLRPGDILVSHNEERPIQAVIDHGGPSIQIILASGPSNQKNNSIFSFNIRRDGNGGLRYPARITAVKQ